MTYEEARKTGKPFNRKKYKDGFYYTDSRGIDCSCTDLSLRQWTEEDKKATDWETEDD